MTGDDVYYGGFIDEIRISKNLRAASWLETSYNTMRNTTTFVTFGSEEPYS